MKSRKILLFLIGLCITFLLTGCKTETAEGAGNAENPINVAKKSFPEFKVARIESLMPPNASLGRHSSGLFIGFTYYAGSTINPETILADGKRMSELYTASIKKELREAGYKTSFFYNENARFSISGTILSAQFNTSQNVFRQSLVNAAAAITVKWEVSDQEKGR